MEAKELVGKRIVSEVVTDELNAPAGTAFKVVGYGPDLNWAIIDAGRWGWKELDPEDRVTEKCKTYWYVRPVEITKVL